MWFFSVALLVSAFLNSFSLYGGYHSLLVAAVAGALCAFACAYRDKRTGEKIMPTAIFLCIASCISTPLSGEGFIVLRTWDGPLVGSHVTLITIPLGKDRDRFGTLEAEGDEVKVTQFATLVMPYRTRVWHVEDYFYEKTLTVHVSGKRLTWDVRAHLLPSTNPNEILRAATRFRSKKKWDRELRVVLDDVVVEYNLTQKGFSSRFFIPYTDTHLLRLTTLGYSPGSNILVRNLR